MNDRKVILQKIKKLQTLFKQGEIPTLEVHVVYPDVEKGSRENYLYFTLAPALNFQRSSPALWLSALKTYDDPETQFLFFPEEVVNKRRVSIQSALLKHKLALQPNKHTDIWITLSKTLYDQYAADPRKILNESDYDVIRILNLLQKEKRAYFPYLSGPKLSNYWLYILDFYTDVKLKNKNHISIIPDTHVAQASVVLGVADKVEPPQILEKKWQELLAGESISPSELHAVLWNWSRNNFIPEV